METTETTRPRPDAPPRPSRSPRRRRAAGIAVLALALLALAACRPVWPVRVVFLNDADSAAAWLETDYATNGGSYSGGKLADLILALAATSGDRATAEAALADLEAVAATYTQPGGSTDVGATAKVVLAVQALGGDPTSFGGLDLEAALRAELVTSGADEGRFGSAGVFAQALAMMALARTPAGVPATSATWLVAQQCPDGSFSWGACENADADHTALAGSALLAAGGHANPVLAATLWLLSAQEADGGFSYGGSGSNTSSSGLAAQLLRATNHPAEADAAGAFVAGVQYGPADGVKDGAIPYQAGVDFDLVFGTTQGALAFGAGPYHQLSFARVLGAPCPDANGVTVVVDLARFDGTIRVSCAVGPQATGWAALSAAGFTVGDVPGFEGTAACTIDGHPAAGFPECWNTGYWSYWHDTTGSGTWTAAASGAAFRVPPAGSVDGWRYEPDWATHVASAPGIAPSWS